MPGCLAQPRPVMVLKKHSKKCELPTQFLIAKYSILILKKC